MESQSWMGDREVEVALGVKPVKAFWIHLPLSITTSRLQGSQVTSAPKHRNEGEGQ